VVHAAKVRARRQPLISPHLHTSSTRMRPQPHYRLGYAGPDAGRARCAGGRASSGCSREGDYAFEETRRPGSWPAGRRSARRRVGLTWPINGATATCRCREAVVDGFVVWTPATDDRSGAVAASDCRRSCTRKRNGHGLPVVGSTPGRAGDDRQDGLHGAEGGRVAFPSSRGRAGRWSPARMLRR